VSTQQGGGYSASTSWTSFHGSASDFGTFKIGWVGTSFTADSWIDYLHREQTNSAPSIDSVLTTPSNISVGDNVDFSYDVSDDGTIDHVLSEVFYENGTKLNETNISYGATPVNDTVENFFSPSSAENYTLYATAYDNDGASSVESLNKYAYDPDTTPPEVTIHNPQNTTSNSPDVALDVSANESISTWEYQLDGNGTNITFTPNTTINGLSTGQHDVQVWATDSGGNTAKDQVYFSTEDNTQPNISFNSGATSAGTLSQDWILGKYDVSDDFSVNQVLSELSTNQSTSDQGGGVWQFNHTSLSDGTYTLQGWAEDNSGNWNSTSERTITLDTTPPGITINNPLNATLGDATPDLKVSATETVDTWIYQVDNQGNTTFTPNTTLSSLSDGLHNVSVWANDSVGNTAGLTRYFTVDTTPPTTSDNVSTGWHTDPVSVGLSCSDTTTACSSTDYRIDAGSWQSGTVFSVSSDGNHTVEYNSTDTVGNTETSNSINVAVDTLAPSLSFDSSSSTGPTEDTWAVVNVSRSDSTSGVSETKAEFDGTNYTLSTCSGSYCWRNFTGLADGDHSYYAWTTDNAGNYNQTATQTVTTGSSAPAISSVTYNRWGIGSSLTEFLDYSLSDADTNIKNHTTFPAGTVSTFTNTTLQVDDPGTPFDTLTTVADDTNFFSSTRQVNYTVTMQHGAYTENNTGTVNETEQAVNASTVVDVRGDCLQLEVNYTQPSVVKTEVENGVSTSCVTGQQNVSGQWIVDHIETTLYSHQQNTAKSSNTSTQHLQRTKQVKNNWSTAYGRLTVSPVSINGSCSNCSNRVVNLSGNTARNETFHSTGDWITDQTSYSLERPNDTVRYGDGITDNFTTRQNLSVANNQTLDLTVDLTPAIPDMDGCSVTNSTSKMIGAGATENHSFYKDCSPGKESSYSLKKTVLNSSTKYVYNATTTVHTNLTEEVKHKYYVPVSRLTEFSSRNDTVQVQVDFNSTGVALTTETVSSTDYAVLLTYTNHTQSSKHDGDHTETITYYVEDSSSSGGGGSGGGGSSGSSDDTTLPAMSPYNWNVKLLDSDWKDRFMVDTKRGESFSREIRLTHGGSNELTLDITCVGNQTCEWTTSSVDQVTFTPDGKNFTTVTINGSIPDDIPRDTYTVTYRVSDPAYVQGLAADVGKVDVVVEMEVNSLLGTVGDWVSAFFGLFENLEFSIPVFGD
jgi:hypothetical protein